MLRANYDQCRVFTSGYASYGETAVRLRYPVAAARAGRALLAFTYFTYLLVTVVTVVTARDFVTRLVSLDVTGRNRNEGTR